jgi:hypothetical protein
MGNGVAGRHHRKGKVLGSIRKKRAGATIGTSPLHGVGRFLGKFLGTGHNHAASLEV